MALNLLQNDEVSYTEVPPELAANGITSAKVMEFLQNIKTTVVNLETGQRRTVTGQVAIDGELMSLVRAEGDLVLLRSPKSNRERRVFVAGGKTSTSTFRAGENGDPDIAFDRLTDQLTISLDGKVLHKSKTPIKLTTDESIEVRFAPGRRTFLAASSQGSGNSANRKILILDIQSGRQQVVDIPPEYSASLWNNGDEHSALSPDGTMLVLSPS